MVQNENVLTAIVVIPSGAFLSRNVLFNIPNMPPKFGSSLISSLIVKKLCFGLGMDGTFNNLIIRPEAVQGVFNPTTMFCTSQLCL